MDFTRKRRLLRWSFLLLCILPTMAVCSQLALSNVEHARRANPFAWQTALSQVLGLSVNLDGTELEGGSLLKLHRVVLADPETNKKVLSAGLAEATAQSDRVVVLLSQTELRVSDLVRLGEVLQHRLLRRQAEIPAIVELLADRVTLLSGENDEQGITLEAVRLVADTTLAQPEVFLEFQLPGSAANQPARLELVRKSDLEGSYTQWRLQTGSQPLPCGWLSGMFAVLKPLGENAKFHGVMEAYPSENRFEIAGTFSQIEMLKVTQTLPQQIAGEATLFVNPLRIVDGQVAEAAGELSIAGGRIERTLLLSLAEALQLSLPPAELPQVKHLPFTLLSSGFEANRSGLVLRGKCDDSGTLIADGTGPLLQDRPGRPVAVVSFARALVPFHDVQVPASAQTQQLLPLLPWPDAGSSTRLAQPPGSSLRLRN